MLVSSDSNCRHKFVVGFKLTYALFCLLGVILSICKVVNPDARPFSHANPLRKLFPSSAQPHLNEGTLAFFINLSHEMVWWLIKPKWAFYHDVMENGEPHVPQPMMRVENNRFNQGAVALILGVVFGAFLFAGRDKENVLFAVAFGVVLSSVPLAAFSMAYHAVECNRYFEYR